VSGPIAQIGSVRGSTSFSANYLKTYLDGVELASPFMLFAIDPDIVDRIEVIRGPQGSALYGSDAISGVAHIVTHKGAIGGGWQPRVEGNASGGVVQTSFAAHSPTTHREFVGARGGGTLASYYAGVSLTESGSYVATASANQASATLAGRAIAGSVLLEGTARTLQATFTAPVSPVLARSLGTRAAPVIAREREGQLIREHTLGVTVIHEPSQRWRQTLVAGYDRNVGALAPQRNPASVADALLGASEEDAQRASLRYSTSLRGHVSDAVGSALTAGVELSWLERARSGPADLIGVPSTSTSRSVALYVDTVRNAGAFAQWKVDIADALFLVAGARGERNSSFGSGYGTAWAPMAGVSYVRQFEDVTVKLRSAYGRGMRPPPPSARKALATKDYRQVANPTLAPETQSGVEGGLEIYAANRFSVSLTGFDQRAEGLIQHVVPDPRLAPRSVQQQNVGEISNRGIELQAAGRAGPFRADAMLSTVASRVEALSRYYTGDLRRGDRVPEVPSFSGAASIAAAGHGVRLELGAIFLGTWTGYDWLSYYAALAQGTETPLRDYRTEYPGTVRPNIVLSHDVTARFGWFARVDNLTNRQRDGRDNLQVLAGRTTRIGVRWE
jgi:iron complex outermembrane receptor protein